MSEIVNCAQCGKQLPHGDAYCSLEVHSDGGFGYDVCSKCYLGEMQRKLSIVYLGDDVNG